MPVRYNNYMTCKVGDVFNLPIISSRAPTTADRSDVGTIWCHQDYAGTDNVYVLTSIVNNLSYWTGCGGGTGTFDAVTVNPGNITATAGDVVITAGDLSIPLGGITVGAFGTGLVFSSAAGVFSSSAGTNGQVVIGGTGGNPAWATLTAGAGIAIADGANSITITATGATASSFDGDAGNAVPDGTGTTTMAGGTNITTAAAVNTVTFNLDDNVTLVGGLTAGVDLTMSTGVCTITGTTDAPQTIYLRANAGTAETIDIHADQGTGVDSVNIHSDLGGLTLASGLASTDAINITATAGGIDMDSVLQTNIASSENSATAIYLHASAGGIGIRGDGGAGEPITVETSSNLNLVSTYNAANSIYIHANGGATESIYIHSDQGTAADSINIDSDVGGISVVSGLASNDAINITSTAGGLDVDAALQISIVSSQAAATALVIDASDAAGGIDCDYGTGGMTIDGANGAFTLQTGTGNILLGADAVEHDITIGNITGDTVVTLNSGTGGCAINTTGAGDFVVTSADTVLIDSAGVLELNSSAGIINIANDVVTQPVNIAIAGERILTLGSTTTASQTVVDCGTAGASFGASANAHATTIGSTDTTSTTTIQSGTGDLVMTSTDAVTVDAAGVLELNSSAGAISIGNDDIDQAINIGTTGERVCTIGNIVGVTGIALNSGTAGIGLVSTGAGDITLASGDTVLIDGAGVIEINSSAGAISIANDDIDQAVNISTDGERLLTLGSANGAAGVVVNGGTTTCSFAANATDHTTNVGSVTGVSATTISAGTGAQTFTAGGVFDVNAAGNVTIDSSAGTIGIGVDDIDQAVNIAIDGERTTTIGSVNGAAGVVVDCGTTGASFGASATAHTTTIGSTNTTSATLIQSGTGDVTLSSTDDIVLEAAGQITADKSIELLTATTGIFFQEGPRVIAGAGSPAGAVTAPQGSLYLRTNGTTTNDRAYINTDGGTTWTALTTAA